MNRNTFSRWLKPVVLALGVFCLSVHDGSADQRFSQWLNGFSHTAEKEGIGRDIWQKAFAGIHDPDLDVLEKAQYQPEFTTDIWDYVDLRVTAKAREKGLQMGRMYAQTLAGIEQRFGVERQIVLAIWSMESNYGEVLKKTDRLHYVPLALATLAYGDPKRGKFGRTQLIAALKILRAGDIDRSHLMGSWAGAMGHTQFIPTSYLSYGVDFDGNGRRDIWNSVPDALATAANLLHKNGWRYGQLWGYEVDMRTGAERYSGRSMSLRQWQALGIRQINGQPLPASDDKAECLLPAGPHGPAYLMMKNFYVIKRYNNANSYALSVGLLANYLRGSLGPRHSWPRPPGALNSTEKVELQRLLKMHGYYQGDVDGYFGDQSRKAIRSFQKNAGLAPDGVPSKIVLERLRKKGE
jgi:membrane-bound lytic murein transglycosylase B